MSGGISSFSLDQQNERNYLKDDDLIFSPPRRITNRIDLKSIPDMLYFFNSISTMIDDLDEMKGCRGLSIIIEIASAYVRGLRSITWGEGIDFLTKSKNMSRGGAKKLLKRLISIKLLVPIKNPCIDKVVDLHLSRKFLDVFPIKAADMSLYRNNSEGFLERKKIDILNAFGDKIEDQYKPMADCYKIWCSQKSEKDLFPRDAIYFTKNSLRSESKCHMTGLIYVGHIEPKRYEILACDGIARKDKYFMKGVNKKEIGNFRSSLWRLALIADYNESKVRETPLFHHLKGKVHDYPHNYLRMILPFATDGFNINYLITIVQERS